MFSKNYMKMSVALCGAMWRYVALCGAMWRYVALFKTAKNEKNGKNVIL